MLGDKKGRPEMTLIQTVATMDNDDQAKAFMDALLGSIADQEAIFKLIQQTSFNPDAALHYAATRGNHQVIKSLLDCVQDDDRKCILLSQLGHMDQTPLQLAAENRIAFGTSINTILDTFKNVKKNKLIKASQSDGSNSITFGCFTHTSEG